jgi:hypothetical protein
VREGQVQLATNPLSLCHVGGDHTKRLAFLVHQEAKGAHPLLTRLTSEEVYRESGLKPLLRNQEPTLTLPLWNINEAPVPLARDVNRGLWRT